MEIIEMEMVVTLNVTLKRAGIETLVIPATVTKSYDLGS
jgi:hypothetical protein